jgi:hypothetical protein
MEESENKSEFKVRDKRRFSPEGESVAEATEETRAEAVPEKEPDPKPAPERAGETAEEETYRPLDFNSFVLSLANTALFQLGLIKAPDAEPMKDVVGARQTIDLLALILEKTRGNLSEQEAKILEETLFQLRMAFVEAAK